LPYFFADLFEALSELIILTASRCLHGMWLVTCVNSTYRIMRSSVCPNKNFVSF